MASPPSSRTRWSAPADKLALSDPASNYVSRAALKLVAGLDAGGIDVTGKICLDVGASTGGFTQVLMERGAARIYAVDVGHDQLHQRLRGSDRVVSIEGFNARDLDAETDSRAHRRAGFGCELRFGHQGPGRPVGDLCTPTR